MESPRSAQQRKTDTLSRLAADIDAWIATGDTAGDGYLVPLSFLWDGTGMIVSTPRASVTRVLVRSVRPAAKLLILYTPDWVSKDGAAMGRM